MFKNPWLILGAYYLFSSIVSGMPSPDDKSGNGYRWLYQSLHLLAANATTVFKTFKNGNGKAQGPTDPQA